MFENDILLNAAYIKLLNTEDALSVALYPLSGYFIDVSNYERFAFLVGAGALDSATTLYVQQATTISGTPKNITGATLTIAADGDDKWYLIEVQTNQLDLNNGYNFVTLNVTGPTGNDYACIWFIGLNPGEKPVTQLTTTGGKGDAVFVGG